MKQKITESQLRSIISKAITENLNELSPQHLMGISRDLKYKASNSLKGKLNKNWLNKKIKQGDRIFNYGQEKWYEREDEKSRQNIEREKEEIKKYQQEFLSRLEDGIYVTVFFNVNSQITAVAIQSKEDAAYYIADTNYRNHDNKDIFNFAQVKGPFNTYKEARAWINGNGLNKKHNFGWDSDEVKNAEIERQKNSIMLGDDFEIEIDK